MDRLLHDVLALAHSYLYDALQYNDVVPSRENRIRLAMQEIGIAMDRVEGKAAPDNSVPATYAGTVCDLGNVNGCPRHPGCGCMERWVERMKEGNKRRASDSAD